MFWGEGEQIGTIGGGLRPQQGAATAPLSNRWQVDGGAETDVTTAVRNPPVQQQSVHRRSLSPPYVVGSNMSSTSRADGGYPYDHDRRNASSSCEAMRSGYSEKTTPTTMISSLTPHSDDGKNNNNKRLTPHALPCTRVSLPGVEDEAAVSGAWSSELAVCAMGGHVRITSFRLSRSNPRGVTDNDAIVVPFGAIRYFAFFDYATPPALFGGDDSVKRPTGEDYKNQKGLEGRARCSDDVGVIIGTFPHYRLAPWEQHRAHQTVEREEEREAKGLPDLVLRGPSELITTLLEPLATQLLKRRPIIVYRYRRHPHPYSAGGLSHREGEDPRWCVRTPHPAAPLPPRCDTKPPSPSPPLRGNNNSATVRE